MVYPRLRAISYKKDTNADSAAGPPNLASRGAAGPPNLASRGPSKQVEAEAELQGWQGFQGWARIRSHAETTDHTRSRDSIFGLVNSTYSFKITNHNQHAFNIKYLANLIKKYWTCFRYQKLANFLVCFPPSVRVHVRWPPSWKICLRIQLSFGFWGRAVKAFDNFSRKLAWLLKTIFYKFWSRDLSPRFSKLEI